MKGYLRIMCIVITVLFSFTILLGCSNSGKKTQESTTVAPNSEQTTEQSQNNGPKKSWQEDTSPFKLEWYVGVASYNYHWDSEKAAVHKVHKENTGLEDINFIVTANESNDKLNALIASNDLPDVITLLNASGKGETQINTLKVNDLVFDLKELSEKYAPDFIKRISPIVLKWHSTADGKYFGHINLTKTPDKIDPETMSSFATNLGIVARKDIMDQLGITLDNFKTKDGFVATLKKVRDAHVKYNGVEISPFLYNGTFDVSGIEWAAQLFGLSYEDKDGNYVMPLKNPKFIEMINFLNRLYREGILLEDNMVLSKDSISEKVANGLNFMVFGSTGSGPLGPFMKNLYADTQGKAQYVSVGPVAPDDGSLPKIKDASLKGWTQTFISKSAKNPERIIRLFDYFSSDEVQMMDMFGIEGQHYTLVNGKVKYNDEVNAIMKKDILLTDSMYGFPDIMWMFRDAWIHKYDPVPSEPEEVMLQEIAKNYAKYQYVGDALGVSTIPGTKEAVTNAKINIYLMSEIPKIVLAKSEQECLQLYQKVLNKVESMGYAQINELFNNQYKEKKKKLDITGN